MLWSYLKCDEEMTDLRVLSSAQIVEGLRSGVVKVAVVGLGYVGLPLTLILVKKGATVIGVDREKNVIEKLIRRNAPIFEPGVDELLREIDEGKLHFTTNLTEAAAEADIIIICVGTPVASDGEPISKDLASVALSVGKALQPGKAVIVRSTVPPGTTVKMIKPRLEKRSRLKAGKDFALAYCPERLVEGNALKEIETVPHLIAAADELSIGIAKGFFSFVGGEVIRATTIATAEIAKIFDNVYRDVNIALANELALICEAVGVDILEAIKVANTGPRTRILTPGCGVGGSCLTKDPNMLSYIAKRAKVRPTLIAAARQRNRYMPFHTIGLVRSAYLEMGKRIPGSKIAIMGLAYKGETDDLRESVAIHIAKELAKMKAILIGYDPYVSEKKVLSTLGKITLLRDPLDAAKGTDCLVITADHNQLRGLNPSDLIKLANKPAALVDGRNVIDPAEAVKAGFVFRGVGRRSSSQVRKL